MEIYRLPPIAGGVDEEEAERTKLERRLLNVLEGRQTVEALIVARPPPAPGLIRVQPPSVRISNEDSDFYSIVDVVAQDRPGLLYDITSTIGEHNLAIYISKAATIKDQVTDTFYLKDERGVKLLDEDRIEALRGALLEAAAPPVEAAGDGRRGPP